jgi:hypothetical protein
MSFDKTKYAVNSSAFSSDKLEAVDTFNVILVLGVQAPPNNPGSSDHAPVVLVGVSTTKSGAEKIIASDYVEFLKLCGKTPLDLMISKGDDGLTYSIPGYTWSLVSVRVNQLVNQTF